MSARKSVYLAVFGLSLRDLNDLKEQIKKIIPSSVEIHWSNVAEPKLQALLINENFFETPSIQNLIRTNNVNVLRIISRSGRDSVIEDNILYLPVINSLPLENWLSKNVLDDSQVAQHQPVVEKKTSSESFANKANFIKELLSPQNGRIQVFDRHGQLGIADTRKQIIFTEPARTLKNTDHSLNFTYATMNDSARLREQKQQDLLFWLWSVLWKSPEYLDLAPRDGCLQLKFWPQPEEGFDRRDILRMSACFSEGADIEVVAKHLDIPLERIRQYVAATIAVGFGEMIPKSKAKFSIPSEEQAQKEEAGGIRKFFGSLRRRLGL